MVDINKIKTLLGNADEELRIKGLRYLRESQNGPSVELLGAALGDESWRVRKTAAEIMVSLGDTPRLLPVLVQSLRNEENAGMRNSAAEVLERLGESTVPYLVQFLTDEDQDLRKFVIDILGNIGDKRATPFLVKALTDTDENVKSAAAENLGKIADEEAVNSLINALDSNDLLLQFSALEALCKSGKGLPVSKVTPYLNNPLLKKAAYDVLGVSKDIGSAPYLLKGLEDRSHSTKRTALVNLVALLESLSSNAPEALSMIEERRAEISGLVAPFLKQDDEKTAAAAIKLLGWLKHKESIKEILPWSSRDALTPLITEMILNIGSDSESELIDAYLTGDNEIKPYICFLLGETGSTNSVDLLIEALRSNIGHIRQSSALSLGRISDKRALMSLLPLFEDEYKDVQEAAAQAFSYLAEGHRDAVVGIIRKCISSDSVPIRRNSVRVLAKLGKKGDLTLALAALRDEEGSIRKDAVEALGALDGEEAAGHLILALSDEERDVKIAAIECLGRMKYKDALKPLLTLLSDEDIWVKSAAIRAVAAIGGKDEVNRLIDLVNNAVGLIVVVALQALGALALGESVPVMIQAMDREDDEIVKSALENLSFSDDERYIDKLKSLLNHENWEIRVSAIKVLSKKNRDGTKELLSKRLKIEDDDLVISSLDEALSHLR